MTEWTEVNEIGEAHDFGVDKTIEGLYMSSKSNVGPNKSMMYQLKKSDGTTVSVWGSTALDGKMSRVEMGDEVRIVYNGKKETEKGGRSYHDYSVYFRKVGFSKLSDDVRSTLQ